MKNVKCLITALSLALNVLLIGYMIGHAGMAPPSPHDRFARSMEALKDLPPEKQAQMKEMMKVFRKDTEKSYEDIRAKREELNNIFTAETFDTEAFKAKAKELGTLFADNKRAMIDKIADTAKTMSQEDRKILANMLNHPIQGPMMTHPPVSSPEG